MYQELKFKIVGVSPLLCHNGQTADPLNQFSKDMKKISGKRAKTEDDYLALARIEWYAGLYLKDGRPVLPGWVFEACMIAAAKKTRKGQQAQIGFLCPDDAPIEYEGAQDLEQLWNDPAFRLTVGVRIQRNKVMRTRPKFDKWAVSMRLLYDPQQFDEADVWAILETAGAMVGVCDWRPKFGRFEIVRG